MPNKSSRPAQRRYFRVASGLGALAVIAGAFGAHGLEERLDADALAVWQTAVEYHVYHAIALFAFTLGVLPSWENRWSVWTCRAWTGGVIVFSGSLYALALSGVGWLGAITPIGGVAYILGWVFAAVSVAKPKA